MTQRVELAAVMDRLAIDSLITEYAVTVDDGDWDAYRQLFTPDGRADYSSAGGVDASAAEVAEWLAGTMELFPMRQHLIVNRRLRFGTLDQDIGDTAQVQADYVNPMRFTSRGDGGEGDDGGGAASSAPDFICGGRYAFSALRTHEGWQLRQVTVQEKWRRTQQRARTRTPG
ncbi:nuclear transport factor 2 family protein [Streptomyces sp. BA2]|uniref:nuclear transport factor 2 family protein n=1 Tax=Streptomyces sp. BA2 TaxID=436595 RepID=UPI0013272566|nr:nuclear transport factor 2 family protein [Streptomyces sp. BA2]MWA09671.1 nuclear transport factor 2 family protein [Streptomyces sp. BA2]